MIADQWALRRPVGGTLVMLEQKNCLVEAAQQVHIAIEVIPADVGAHDGLGGSFAIADFENALSVCLQEGAVLGLPADQPKKWRESSFDLA